ncbi:transglycosylase domain-containing protein [Aquimarina macrocephali]|uniref:transglycosylase domain-containing protein n=1 Tax=Aquimarina macrocephali TaxID=666563 RepID=UPI003F68138D
MKKRILKLSKILFLLGLIASIALYFFIINSWKFHLTESELSEFTEDIKRAEKLPEKFYELYNMEFDGSLENAIVKQEFRSLMSGTNKSSINLWTSRFYLHMNNKKYYKNMFFTAHSLALKTEKKTTKKENLNWIMNEMDFLNLQNGIKSASIFYFGKELFKLNDKELATLVIISKNPSLYNPLRRPELVNRKAESLMNKKTMANKMYKS